jgi:hypothetical protein
VRVVVSAHCCGIGVRGFAVVRGSQGVPGCGGVGLHRGEVGHYDVASRWRQDRFYPVIGDDLLRAEDAVGSGADNWGSGMKISCLLAKCGVCMRRMASIMVIKLRRIRFGYGFGSILTRSLVRDPTNPITPEIPPL